MDRPESKKLRHFIDYDFDNFPYQGRARVERLLFIANKFQPLRIEAYKLAIAEILKGSNPEKYTETVRKLNVELEAQRLPTVDVDLDWVSQTTRRISEQTDHLEQELIGYRNNMIKESIRMGYNDLGNHYRDIGNLEQALKCYRNTRDYCTIPFHILDMTMNVIETGMEIENSSLFTNQVLKITQLPTIPEKKECLDRIFALSGIYYLRSSLFQKAAVNFLQVPFEISSKLWHYICAKDIAVYGGLCALASFERSELKTSLMDNSNFKLFLELEPKIKSLIVSFYHSKFNICFELLEDLRNELQLDIFLSKHLDSIYGHIKNKALIQYCSPFLSIDMERMCQVFNYTMEDLEASIVALITDNQLNARIDSHNKVIRAKTTNERASVYSNALSMGNDFQINSRYLLLRSKLLQHNMVLMEEKPAMIRNDKRIVALHSQTQKPIMYIYSSSGRLINQFQWEKSSLAGIGWTIDERLVCVLEQGLVFLYDIHGSCVQVSLGDDATEFGILEVNIFPDGLVALTGNYKFISITNWEEPRPKLLSNLDISQKPECWVVLPPDYNLSRHLEVYVSTKNTVFVLDYIQTQDQLLSQRGPFLKMALSPNGKFLALFTGDGRLWVVSTDFQVSFADFKTNSTIPPLQIAWCGNDSVLLHWEDIVLMVGPSGDYLKYAYEGIVQIITEIDCARVISSEYCEIIEQVPVANQEVFKIGSTTPSAILFDARDHYDKKHPKADENIRSIRVSLTKAVDSCIEAASAEFDTALQKSLLKAASFGKGFLENHPASKLVDMNRTLRILNSVRDHKIGIPLTYRQYMNIGIEGLCQILINRRHFALAKACCDYLKFPSDQVLIHWACHTVKTSKEDEESVSRMIFNKLSEKQNISYSNVAKEAHKAGRTKLATKLLEFEPLAAEQVPLLLSMKQDELALKKAIESGDTDLVYLVLFHMKRTLTLPEFFRIINDKPLACSLLEIYAKQQDPALLRDFYYQDDRRGASANLTFDSRLVELKAAWKMYGEQKETSKEAKVVDESIKLLQIQNQLEKDINQRFLDLSLYDTILKCFVLKHSNEASKLKATFKVSDKRFLSLEFRSIIELRDWNGMESFLKNNPNFNFKFGLDLLLSNNFVNESNRFVELLAQQYQKEAKEYREVWQKSKIKI